MTAEALTVMGRLQALLLIWPSAPGAEGGGREAGLCWPQARPRPEPPPATSACRLSSWLLGAPTQQPPLLVTLLPPSTSSSPFWTCN